jgi:chromosome segregation ATPase
MSRVDLTALQQRLAQQQPKPPIPVLAEPPSGTLRATTTMRAALPLKATNARGERAEERAMVKALRAQIDELNAEMAVASAEAERAVAAERQRADRLNKQVETLSAEVVRAKKQAEAVVGRAERAEADRDAERARADALRTAIAELKAGQALMIDMHARELAAAQDRLERVRDAAEAIRQAEAARKARGLVARLRAALRGEWRASR